jgi:hypothetical protein
MTCPLRTVAATRTSGHWRGGIRQGTASWCFAAADQIVQRGFGDNAVTQAEIAHRVLLSRGESGDTEQDAAQYHQGIRQIVANFSLADTSWNAVAVYVGASGRLHPILQNAWGTPQLAGRTAAAGGILTMDEIRDTIDDDGLIIFGDQQRWKVVYGYTVYDDQSVTLKVYDPWGMGTNHPDYDLATAQAQMRRSYRVTA